MDYALLLLGLQNTKKSKLLFRSLKLKSDNIMIVWDYTLNKDSIYVHVGPTTQFTVYEMPKMFYFPCVNKDSQTPERLKDELQTL